ncbi:toll/interleukin-1 receptor domain-containing protein [Geomonas edaphica]|uniref:toll/interleukin-1 receptor domain-containing protein n=1 Tax=Geomonas edaphica TaxID=2570226 RepID=UPI0010A8D237|nr:toll/interleukin-1 receptor domain-containing protein [Geomonas edaphica]
MRVFISWSGERSKFVAEAIRNWLPKVLQTLRPWMSQEDISAGARWLTDVSSELSQAKVGIICVTPENQHNPWLQFESGALSKTIDQTFVCPVLLEMQPGQLTGPLTQFQSVVLDHSGVMRLLKTLNSALVEHKMPESELEEIFEVWWPKLSNKISTVPIITEPIARRTSDEMLEELLQNTREQLRRENLRLEYSKERDIKLDNFVEMFESSFSHLNTSGELLSKVKKVFESFPQTLDLNCKSSPDEPSLEQLNKAFNQMKDMAAVGKIVEFDVSALARGVTDMKELSLKQKELTENILNGPDSE